MMCNYTTQKVRVIKLVGFGMGVISGRRDIQNTDIPIVGKIYEAKRDEIDGHVIINGWHIAGNDVEMIRNDSN